MTCKQLSSTLPAGLWRLIADPVRVGDLQFAARTLGDMDATSSARRTALLISFDALAKSFGITVEHLLELIAEPTGEEGSKPPTT